jgi:hypothetical protein
LGDKLSAVSDANGTVYVWKTTGATTTYVGSVPIPGAGFWTGTGRAGLQLPTNARVDDFAAGTTLPIAAPTAIALGDASASYLFIPFVSR